MPRGVLWAVGGSVILGMIALIGFTVAIPDLKTVEAAPLPLLAIAGYWLPSWLVKVFVAFVVFSMFAILVVGSGAQARLVYSMSRDNMLPFSGALRKINARSQTPIVALLVFGVIDLGVMIYGYDQPSAFGTLVGATAIIPYIIYFLITLAYAVKRRTTDSLPGAFNLGRWAWPVIIFVLAYTVLIMVVLSLPAPFHGADKVLGYGLALAALWYFGGLLWRLKKGTAGVKPVEDLIEGPPQAGDEGTGPTGPVIGSTTRQGTRTGWAGSSAFSTSASATGSAAISRWSVWSRPHWFCSVMLVTPGPDRNADVYGVTTSSFLDSMTV